MALTRQQLVTLAVVASSALAAGGIATAATKSSSKSAAARAASGTTGASGDHDGGPHNEAALTGDKLRSASDAAIAANPGANVTRASAEDPAAAGSAVYEVKITKADGSRAEVLEDASFNVLSTQADGGRGGHDKGDRDHGGNADEKALTGDDLTKATAAANDAVPGGTVERATAEEAGEAPGAAYEANVEKADGSDVDVLLDKDFKVIKTVSDQHGHGGHGHR